MIKKSLIALFSLVCCLLLLACAQASEAPREAPLDDFINDVRKLALEVAKSGAGELRTTHSISRSVILNYVKPETKDMRYTTVFRSKNSLTVLGTKDEGPDNKNPQDVAYFMTKDPSLVFAGGVSVGGSAKKAFQLKKPGAPNEEYVIEEGEYKGYKRYIWYWLDAEGTSTPFTVGMTVKGDVIQEIDFYDEVVSIGVESIGKNWEKVQYLGFKPSAAPSTSSFAMDVSDIMSFLIKGTDRLKVSQVSDEEMMHRSKNVVIVESSDGDYSYYPYFQTIDPSLVFPGKIKVGGSLKAAISSNKIPGKKQAVKKTKEGLDAHMWSTKNYDFTLRCKGDIIREIVYFHRAESPQISWKLVRYLK